MTRAKACLRKGCEKKLPAVCFEHGDPYCSAVCARLDHGLDGSETRWGGNCKGCGCPHDEYTEGCGVCQNRMTRRKQAAA